MNERRQRRPWKRARCAAPTAAETGPRPSAHARPGLAPRRVRGGDRVNQVGLLAQVPNPRALELGRGKLRLSEQVDDEPWIRAGKCRAELAQVKDGAHRAPCGGLLVNGKPIGDAIGSDEEGTSWPGQGF